MDPCQYITGIMSLLQTIAIQNGATPPEPVNASGGEEALHYTFASAALISIIVFAASSARHYTERARGLCRK